MANLTVKQMRTMFFDRAGIKEAIAEQFGPKNGSVLQKFATYVYQRAKTSIRKRKKISSPGEPPSSHLGHLREGAYGIQFGYDPQTATFVVGPLRMAGAISQTAPAALEYGGSSIVYRGRGRYMSVEIGQRPYMSPALEKELPGLTAMLKNCVKST